MSAWVSSFVFSLSLWSQLCILLATWQVVSSFHCSCHNCKVSTFSLGWCWMTQIIGGRTLYNFWAGASTDKRGRQPLLPRSCSVITETLDRISATCRQTVNIETELPIKIVQFLVWVKDRKTQRHSGNIIMWYHPPLIFPKQQWSATKTAKLHHSPGPAVYCHWRGL
jgi:hypothetical protein